MVTEILRTGAINVTVRKIAVYVEAVENLSEVMIAIKLYGVINVTDQSTNVFVMTFLIL